MVAKEFNEDWDCAWSEYAVWNEPADAEINDVLRESMISGTGEAREGPATAPAMDAKVIPLLKYGERGL